MDTELGYNITPDVIKDALDYADYTNLIVERYQEGRTTNDDNSEGMLEYTKMNIQRTGRWQKRGELSSELKEKLQAFPKKMIWLVITEGWCGDAAQSLPFIHKMAEESDNIELKLILRDEYPEIIDEFLTNGNRSIPKLIALDEDTLDVLGTWGPRPKPAQEKYMAERANPDIENAKASENLHLWYARDKGRTIQTEFMDLLKKWE